MRITEVLDRISSGLTDEHKVILRNNMTDFYSMKAAFQDIETSEEVAEYLVVEIEGDNRPSFVSRILGRYRVMLNSEVLDEVSEWAYQKRKLKSTSTSK